MAMKVLFWSCVLLIGYSYLLYPMMLFILSGLRSVRKRQNRTLREDRFEWPAVTMLVAAHNEEGVIREKIDNCLAIEYPRNRFRTVIASDGSVDATNTIVFARENPRIALIAYPKRQGKIGTLNATLPALKDEIIVDVRCQHHVFARRRAEARTPLCRRACGLWLRRVDSGIARWKRQRRGPLLEI